MSCSRGSGPLPQVMPLRPLGKKAGERLVQHVLGKQVPKETVARIVSQSEGNALFLEELIRAVAEGRGEEAPETVLAMLQARIGRLPAGARRVLRAASVFGETTWLGGIGALLGRAQAGQDPGGWISRLTQDEILEARGESRFPGEQEYRFRHRLMCDAAYGLLMAEDRVEAHRIAGQYLEARGEPDALVLAEHFVQGEARARAIPYFIQAAEQSYEARDMDAAMALAERGLACGVEGEQRGALLSVQLGVYHGRERYAEIIELGTEALDLLPEGSKRWCRTTQQVFPALTLMRQGAPLEQLAARFARIEPPVEARGEYIKAAIWLSTSLGAMGRKDASRTFLERARQIGAALDRSEPAIWGSLKVGEYTAHNLIEEAPWSRMVASAEAREAFRAAGDQRSQLFMSSHHGKSLLELGDRAGAEAELRQSLSLAELLHEARPLAYARTYLARLLASFAAVAALDEPAELAGKVIDAKHVELSSVAYGVLAETKRRRGDLAGADAEACAACEAARPFPPVSWDLIALRTRILLDLERTSEALRVGEEAVRAPGSGASSCSVSGWGRWSGRSRSSAPGSRGCSCASLGARPARSPSRTRAALPWCSTGETSSMQSSIQATSSSSRTSSSCSA
jgi:tetratricopeptide (TPR) repeat protein